MAMCRPVGRTVCKEAVATSSRHRGKGKPGASGEADRGEHAQSSIVIGARVRTRSIREKASVEPHRPSPQISISLAANFGPLPSSSCFMNT